MIQKFVDRFIAKKKQIRDYFTGKHPDNYQEIVKLVIDTIHEEYGDPSSKCLHEIDDGDYQGTLLYIIGGEEYQPSDYWCVAVNYGSCSGCDTLQGIREYSDEPPTEQQIKDYYTLALHCVQNLRHIAGYSLEDK